MSDEFTLGQATDRPEGAWVAIPDQSLLSARVLTVNKTKMPFQDKDTGEDVYRVKWVFQVTDPGQFDGRKVDGMTSTAFVNHAECRMYQWVSSLLGGGGLPEGFVFKTEDVEGLDCEVLVEMKEKPRRDGNGMWINNSVVDVRPAENRPVPVGSAFGGTAVDEEPF